MVSVGSSARRGREHRTFWMGVCFQCTNGHPDNWQRFRPHEAPVSARESARSWMVDHVCRAEHSDLLIGCGRLENGATMHALPPMLLDDTERRRLLEHVTVVERALARRDKLRNLEQITVLLPTGHLVESVSSVMDAVTAYAALTACDLDD